MKLIRKTQKTSCSKENQEPKHSNYSDLLLKKLREQHVENQNKNFPIGTTSDINYRRNSSFFFSILTHTIIEKNEQVKLNQKKKKKTQSIIPSKTIYPSTISWLLVQITSVRMKNCKKKKLKKKSQLYPKKNTQIKRTHKSIAKKPTIRFQCLSSKPTFKKNIYKKLQCQFIFYRVLNLFAMSIYIPISKIRKQYPLYIHQTNTSLYIPISKNK